MSKADHRHPWVVFPQLGISLTCISSSVLLLWLEAHPDRNERLSFSLFKSLLVLPTQALHFVCVGG